MYGVTAFFVIIGALWAFYILKLTLLNTSHISNEEFGEWAYGPGYKERSVQDNMKAWNELHAEKSGLILNPEIRWDELTDDLVIMEILWHYYKENGRYPKCQKD